MATILFIGIAVSLLLYYLIWYGGHRGHRQIARGIQTLNALEAVQASYRAGDYQTGLQQSEALKRGSSKTPEYCFLPRHHAAPTGKVRRGAAHGWTWAVFKAMFKSEI